MPLVKHDLSAVFLGYIRSLLKPAPKTPHASLASSGMPKALWHCSYFLPPPPFEVASDTSAMQMWRGTRRRNHTDLIRNLFCLGLQTNRCWIRPGSYSSLLNVGHQHGKNNFWKSSWLRKEIVSHIEGFKRPYNNKQGYLFWWTLGFQGQKQPKSLQSQW